MNRKTMWIVLSVLVMSSLILSACAPAAAPATPAAQQPAAQQPAAQATTAPAAKETVTIRWRTRPDNKAEQDVYQQINDELNKKLAAQGIQLQYDPAPVSGYFDKLTTEFSAGNAPDIAWVGGANTADYTPKGVIMDLKPMADADKSFNVANFYDAPMKELEQGGKLWGLPRDISTLVMYYNKDMFKAKGLSDPAELAAKGQWNWDAFQKAAVALTDPAKKQYGFSMSNWWGLWGWFVNSGGGSLFNADRTACNLTDPGSIKGLQFMADLFLKDKVATPPGIEGGVAETDFHAGNVAMFPNGRWMTPAVRQDKFDWGVVEMPTSNDGKQATWLFWGPYLISAKTKYPDQAWTVLKELTSPEVQAKIAALGTNIPSNKDKAAVDAFLNSKPPADNTPFVKGASYANAEMALFTGNWGDIGAAYQTEIDKIFAGKSTVQEAVKAACDNANPMFKK
jgi:multiple sugar transport system substrate-binding protein